MVKRYEKVVRRWLYRMVRSSADLDDLCQCVFIRAYIRRGRFDPKKGSLTSWLHRITHNIAVSHLRKRRLATLSLDAMTEETGPSCPGPEEEHEALARALEQLDRLTSEERDVFILRALLQLPWAEIAEEQRCSLKTAHNRFTSALLKLRRAGHHKEEQSGDEA